MPNAAVTSARQGRRRGGYGSLTSGIGYVRRKNEYEKRQREYDERMRTDNKRGRRIHEHVRVSNFACLEGAPNRVGRASRCTWDSQCRGPGCEAGECSCQYVGGEGRCFPKRYYDSSTAVERVRQMRQDLTWDQMLHGSAASFALTTSHDVFIVARRSPDVGDTAACLTRRGAHLWWTQHSDEHCVFRVSPEHDGFFTLCTPGDTGMCLDIDDELDQLCMREGSSVRCRYNATGDAIELYRQELFSPKCEPEPIKVFPRRQFKAKSSAASAAADAASDGFGLTTRVASSAYAACRARLEAPGVDAGTVARCRAHGTDTTACAGDAMCYLHVEHPRCGCNVVSGVDETTRYDPGCAFDAPQITCPVSTTCEYTYDTAHTTTAPGRGDHAPQWVERDCDEEDVYLAKIKSYGQLTDLNRLQHVGYVAGPATVSDSDGEARMHPHVATVGSNAAQVPSGATLAYIVVASQWSQRDCCVALDAIPREQWKSYYGSEQLVNAMCARADCREGLVQTFASEAETEDTAPVDVWSSAANPTPDNAVPPPPQIGVDLEDDVDPWRIESTEGTAGRASEGDAWSASMSGSTLKSMVGGGGGTASQAGGGGEWSASMAGGGGSGSILGGLFGEGSRSGVSSRRVALHPTCASARPRHANMAPVYLVCLILLVIALRPYRAYLKRFRV